MSDSNQNAQYLSPSDRFIEFMNASPSPYHAVESAKERLKKYFFTPLSEKSSWENTVKPNGRYYFTRNGSTIVAFAVGGKYKPGNGVNIVGAHTDSPCLKLKPISKKTGAGYLKVGVQTYGGGLWHTWFDRNLALAGVVMIEDACGLRQQLVRISDPIAYIPNLAIHLDRTQTDAFRFNNETHLVPILATVAKDLNSGVCSTKNDDVNTLDDSIEKKHHTVLVEKLASLVGVDPKHIVDFDLCLYDQNPCMLGGIYKEFIHSGRLDNLNSSFCAIEALVQSVEECQSLSDDDRIRMVALFDNEEVGSRSAYGADSSLLTDTIHRLQVGGDNSSYEIACANSFLISADMAHAVHPNYPEKHEENHSPMMNKGIVIKINAGQRYCTTTATSAMIKMLANNNNICYQEFVVRNDMPSGSTIGPLMSSNLGIRSIDVGNPMLSMHSIRETMGVDDVATAINLFKAFFIEFSKLDRRVTID
ncbi:hypothetical protein BB561_004183 [Smittium simulii]|uniref:aspartyl aminopeptidase n=1 Tax=Smittium simulii TaxID=133385 RepID=A0A2T9YHK7_9FUNG|nr:hypothetical protein BB561_004183 [Smittium simulii]